MLPANVSQLGPASSKVLGQMCKLQSVQRPAVSSALLQTAGEQRSLGQTCVPRAVASTAGVVAVKEAKKFDSLKWVAVFVCRLHSVCVSSTQCLCVVYTVFVCRLHSESRLAVLAIGYCCSIESTVCLQFMCGLISVCFGPLCKD